MNAPDEEGQRRREDEERPGGRQEGTSLKVEAQRQRIVEGNGEGGKWQGKENAGDDGTGVAPRHFVDRRSLDREGWHHQQDREDRERREIESAKEPEGGAEHEAEEDLRRGARPTGEVRLDREENPDHREGECRARPNRQRSEDEGHERGRRRGPPRIGSVQPSLQGAMDSGRDDPDEDRRIRPDVLVEGLPEREHEEGDRYGDDLEIAPHPAGEFAD